LEGTKKIRWVTSKTYNIVAVKFSFPLIWQKTVF
jgi:hypothetical protein